MTDTELSQLKTVLVHEIFQHVGITTYGQPEDEMLMAISHDVVEIGHHFGQCSYENIKPYLRPLESMTESEKDELENQGLAGSLTSSRCAAEMLWLLQNHFDVFGLVEKGLALPK